MEDGEIKNPGSRYSKSKILPFAFRQLVTQVTQQHQIEIPTAVIVMMRGA